MARGQKCVVKKAFGILNLEVIYHNYQYGEKLLHKMVNDLLILSTPGFSMNCYASIIPHLGYGITDFTCTTMFYIINILALVSTTMNMKCHTNNISNYLQDMTRYGRKYDIFDIASEKDMTRIGRLIMKETIMKFMISIIAVTFLQYFYFTFAIKYWAKFRYDPSDIEIGMQIMGFIISGFFYLFIVCSMSLNVVENYVKSCFAVTIFGVKKWTNELKIAANNDLKTNETNLSKGIQMSLSKN